MRQINYFISVGEPWDFSSPDGENIINGDIIKKVSGNCILFKAKYQIEFDGVSGDVFVLYPRYRGDNFLELGVTVDYVVVNVNLLIDDVNSCNEELLKENSKFVITGSIRVSKGL